MSDNLKLNHTQAKSLWNFIKHGDLYHKLWLWRAILAWIHDGDRPPADQNSEDPECVAGCQNFFGGEVKHIETCPYYPESLTRMNDEIQNAAWAVVVAWEQSQKFKKINQCVNTLRRKLR